MLMVAIDVVMGEKWRTHLRRARDAAGLSQAQAAGALGLTGGAISQWETAGGTVPSLDRAIDLAKLYGVSLSELVGERDDLPRLSEVELAIVRLVRRIGVDVALERLAGTGGGDVARPLGVATLPSPTPTRSETNSKKD